MNPKKRLRILLSIAGIGLFFAIIINAIPKKTTKEPPTPGGVYYTGPMRPKGGGNYLADENGKVSFLPSDMKQNAKAPSKPGAGAMAGE